MKIAIILAGHIRTFPLVKENFIKNIYVKEADLFIDTYDSLYRSDYKVNGEDKINAYCTKEEIEYDFKEFNVKKLNVENEKEILESGKDAEFYQIRKLKNAFKLCLDYEKENNFKYDIIVKTRFDILIRDKLDYTSLFKNSKSSETLRVFKNLCPIIFCCFEKRKKKVIYIPSNNVMFNNDMFAIGNRESMLLYFNRWDLCGNSSVHDSIPLLSRKFNIELKSEINTSICRPDEKEGFVIWNMFVDFDTI